MAERRLHVLNNSRAAAFRRCPRLHYYAYELGYARVDKAEALTTGGNWHDALEEWFTAVKEDDRDNALKRALAVLPSAQDPYQQVLSEVMLTGYHLRWIDDPVEVTGVEVAFEGPLVDPVMNEEHPEFILGGTIDAVCRSGSRHMIMEHKSSSQDFSVGAYYWEKLILNSQVSQYLAAGPILGVELEGCIYDVIGKAPQLPPKLATPEDKRRYTKDGKLYARQRDTDEDPEDYRVRLTEAVASNPNAFYARREVVRTADELEAAILDVWQVAELITEARERSRWPRNTDACFAFNRPCDFYAVCAYGEDLESSDKYVCNRKRKGEN